MANPSISDLRLQLLSRGYHILPNRGKIPALPGWQTVEYLTRELAPVGAKGTLAGRIGRWVRRWPDALSTGLRIEDGLVVLDLDINDAGVVDVLLAGLPDEVLQRGPTRYGSGAKCAVFARHDPDEAPFIRRASRRYNGHCLEVFGGAKLSGDRCSRQFGIYGPHSFYDDGSVAIEYAWAEGVPALHQIDAAELPVITLQQIAALIDRFEALAWEAGWTPDTAPDTETSSVIYDITEATRFDTDKGETVDYAGLCDLHAIHGDWRVRCRTNFMPGPGHDAERTDTCVVFHHARYDCVAVYVHGGGTHLPAQLGKPGETLLQEELRRLKEKLGEEPPAPPPDKLTANDFYGFMPKQNQFVFIPNGQLWPASSVNATLPRIPVLMDDGQPVRGTDGEPITVKPSQWLARHRAVQDQTWSPGDPLCILGKLATKGGWIERPGTATFNRYHPPRQLQGHAGQATRWRELLALIYPHHVDHITAFFAHRIQRPAEKINHGLVLTGAPGIGKDSLLEPLKHGVGPWNFKEVSPHHVMSANNDFMLSVVVLISEARDLGEVNRYAFYEATKTIMAAPPDMVRINVKFVPEYYAPNLTAGIITTNHAYDGVFLPADDRRHYVCGTEITTEDISETYWRELWTWYGNGGIADVVAYLAGYDLSAFSVKRPPEKTAAFWRMADAGRPSEDADFRDVLESLGHPVAVTLDMLLMAPSELRDWIRNPANRNKVPHRMDACGYLAVRNQDAKDGYWSINKKRQAVYCRADLAAAERYAAAEQLTAEQGARQAGAEQKFKDTVKGDVVPFLPKK